MFGNMNPRQMQKMMKRLGMQQQEISASEVIIKTSGKDIIISNPHVSKVNMAGQVTWQIMGEEHEKAHELFSAEDVKTVADQAQVSEDEAKTALQESEGDLAQAILKLKT